MGVRKQHKHYDLIVAWANGYKIQYQTQPDGVWHDADHPQFDPCGVYRIKPECTQICATVEYTGMGLGGVKFTPTEPNVEFRTDNLRLVFEGGSNKLVKAEVL